MTRSLPIASTRRGFLAGGAALLTRPAIARADIVQRLRLAHALPRSHPVHAAIELFVKTVQDRTAGAILIDIFAEGELGQEVQIVEQARQNRLDIVKASASVVERTGAAYRVFNLPFVFRDQAHWQTVGRGPIGESILGSSGPAGLVGLTFYEAGSRSFYAQRPINHPDDLKGLRIRIQPSPTMQRLITLFGAEPVQLPWDLTYNALSTGLVDGAENSVVALIVGRHGEVVRYYSFDEHTWVPDVLLISAARWQSLTPGERDIMKEAAALSRTHMDDLWAVFSADARRKVEAMGVTFTSPDKRPFVERAAPMTSAFGEDHLLADLVSRIRQV